MQLRCDHDPNDRLVVHLREGDEETSVGVRPARAGATTLVRAIDAAVAEGYGECFWPGDPGQYWWIFRRDAETIETIAMWTRGGASLWEHVFRATDEVAFVQARLRSELERCGLLKASS